MKKNNAIQKLFRSQIINPIEMSEEIEKVFGKPQEYEFAVGLLTMFDHPRHTPCVLHYDFSKGKRKDIRLLGKGVLYDSGGYNIKPDASQMHNDKFGALNALTIGAKLKLPVSIFLVVNLIHDHAILPGTIIKSIKEKKVQIIDTDAEGRIGLAHLIELSTEKNLVTMATLTGHSPYAIGDGHAEVFSKDKQLLSKIILKDHKVIAPGRYFKDYDKALFKGKLLQNLNKNYREAGAAKAYAFLNQFLANKQELTHFDIAGLDGKQIDNYTFGMDEIGDIISEIA